MVEKNHMVTLPTLGCFCLCLIYIFILEKEFQIVYKVMK